MTSMRHAFQALLARLTKSGDETKDGLLDVIANAVEENRKGRRSVDGSANRAGVAPQQVVEPVRAGSPGSANPTDKAIAVIRTDLKESRPAAAPKQAPTATTQKVASASRGRDHNSMMQEHLLYRPELAPRLALPPVALATPALDVDVPVVPLELHGEGGTTARRVLGSVPGIRRASGTLRVQVGLDFGTSCTKVMYQILGSAERTIRVISFGHGLTTCPDYALPSLAAFTKNGHLLLADVAAKALDQRWGYGLSRFKMLTAGRVEARFCDRLLDERFSDHVKLAGRDPSSCTPAVISAVYLASVMRRIRRILQRSLSSADLDLRFNMCVPVDQRQNDQVYGTFQKVIALAQLLEQQGEDRESAAAWLDRAVEAWAGVRYQETASENRVFLVPETIAATASYVTSLVRESGLHALVDIGSGTTDVSIFNLSSSRRGGLSIELYATRSIPMGAGTIEERVATQLSGVGGVREIAQSAVLGALGGDHMQLRDRQVIIDALSQMWNGTTKAWSEAYKKWPTESAWRGANVRVFLAGGGALIPESTRVFSQSWQPGWGPYPTRALPAPGEISAIRLAVAAGLAVPVPELGNYQMPNEVSPTSPASSEPLDWRFAGDQLIPGYGWC